MLSETNGMMSMTRQATAMEKASIAGQSGMEDLFSTFSVDQLTDRPTNYCDVLV